LNDYKRISIKVRKVRIGKKIKILITSLVIISTVGFVSFDDDNFQIIKNLDIYNTLFRELNMYYVDEVDVSDLVKTSIDEMLSSLDPYTVYIPESDIEDFKFMTTGQYGGIGALIRTKGDYVIITDPYEGFPAFNAGVKAGDKIIKIDDKSVKGKNSKQISELLKGSPNTEIKLTIERLNSKKPITIKLKREKIKINSVAYSGMLNEHIGYIRLSSFTRGCSKEIKKAFNKLKKDNELEGLVFDLRGNPGGLLMEAIETANLFIEKDQEIVSTKGKVEQWNSVYKAPNTPIDLDIPITVLVNSGSASASEIVSGAIQDLDRGVIIGTRTFGKGLVQATRDLSYNTKLKLTTAKYYIPSGRCIQALDYTHRNEDGSVGRVPDSLISEFKTKAGRIVYDGGGIMPDIKVTSKKYSKITSSLYTKNLFFDYATYFQYKYDTIASVDKFNITDDIYNDFVAFLSDKKYDYTLESEKKLDELEEAIKTDKYDNRISTEIEDLRKKLSHDKSKDLLLFKDEIKELLKDEIVGRYYYQKGRAQSALSTDSTVFKAISILQNRDEYNKILTVGE
jgi:carboxyl-terminal processing protease